jgi:hypothetical protein
VLSFYRDGTNANYIGTEDYVADPQRFANLAVGKGWKLAEDVAQAAPGILFLGKKPAIYTCKSDELEIQAWHRDGTDFDHFMAAQDGKIVYDPWSAGGSDTHRFGKCVGKRVFRVIA